MSEMYIRDASPVNMWLVYRPAVINMMWCIPTSSCLLCYRKYKVTATSAKRSFISQPARATPTQSSYSFLRYRPWVSDLFAGQPWSIRHHIFLFSLPCSAAWNIRLLLHQQSSFILKHASANPTTNKLFVPYLETIENRLTATHMVRVKPQREQLNAQHTLHGKPRWRVKYYM
jgi:hypothetical protein